MYLQTQQHITLRSNAHILVVKLAGIGDLLLATPALQALRETYPLAKIDLLVTPDSAGLLNGWDAINEIIVLNKYLFDNPRQLLRNPTTLRQLAPLVQQLRHNQYDAVLLMHHLTLPFGRLKYQLLTFAAGAKWRVGLDNGHGWFLNASVKDNGFGAMHEADYYLAVAHMIGATIRSTKLFVPLGDEERRQAWRLVYGDAPNDVPHPIIAMHPGSGGYSTARRWSPARFAQLADTLFHDVGGQVLLVGGPEETQLHQDIIGMVRSPVPIRSLAGKGNIKVATAVLELADLFIGNDAGLMHLAVAVNTPTVAIFGLSNHKAWGPYTGEAESKRATVVRLDLPCMPCFYRDHLLGTPEGCATRDCLALLEVDPVAVAARRMLRETRTETQGGRTGLPSM